MKTRVAAATAMLSLAVSASAQITKHQKYDWGWSYKLEMPETGLRCEFPEKPAIRTLAYGYMTAAQYKDELYIAAKLENPDAYDIVCRTEEFTDELKRVYKLPIEEVKWNDIELENGHLSLTADASGAYAQFHIDAIATEDVLTIFMYAHHEELSVPGQFFSDSYSINDIPKGSIVYVSTEEQTRKARVLENVNGSSLVQLQNSPVTVEWPETPTLTVNRNEATYNLKKQGSRYATRVIEVGPQVSYAFFNTFINREHQKLSRTEQVQLVDDNTDATFTAGHEKESFFRKLTYATNAGTHQRYYVAAGNKIYVQELISGEMTVSASRYLNSFEHSVRNEYDTTPIVMK